MGRELLMARVLETPLLVMALQVVDVPEGKKTGRLRVRVRARLRAMVRPRVRFFLFALVLLVGHSCFTETISQCPQMSSWIG